MFSYVAGNILSVDDEWSRLSKYGSNKGLLEAIYFVNPASRSYLFCGPSYNAKTTIVITSNG
jgi:hypothetical protein